jgi:UDP-3-O-[3-hydroxymyristoyl] glucosamine N-acyltransferase
MNYKLSQLAQMIGCDMVGDDCEINQVAPVQSASVGAICFVGAAKFKKYLPNTQASAVIIPADMQDALSTPAIIAKHPRAAYAKIAGILYPPPVVIAGIHASARVSLQADISDSACVSANAVIEAGAVIGNNSFIGAGCYVGHDSVIGDNVRINANVSIYHQCKIGNDCIIHSGTVIGADGFGFEPDTDRSWIKIPQVGGVVIGKNVEIGACSTVDRGAMQDTVIEDGVKLDNHIQIAHNVRVGENTVMSNGVGVAGSTIIGKNCLIGGMTGIKDNIEIADNVMITAMSLVSKSLKEPGSYSSNTPIDDTPTWRKNSARFRQLDELAKRIIQLEKQIKKTN